MQNLIVTTSPYYRLIVSLTCYHLSGYLSLAGLCYAASLSAAPVSPGYYTFMWPATIYTLIGLSYSPLGCNGKLGVLLIGKNEATGAIPLLSLIINFPYFVSLSSPTHHQLIDYNPEAIVLAVTVWMFRYLLYHHRYDSAENFRCFLPHETA
jgi:hypothetical protein